MDGKGTKLFIKQMFSDHKSREEKDKEQKMEDDRKPYKYLNVF